MAGMLRLALRTSRTMAGTLRLAFPTGRLATGRVRAPVRTSRRGSGTAGVPVGALGRVAGMFRAAVRMSRNKTGMLRLRVRRVREQTGMDRLGIRECMAASSGVRAAGGLLFAGRAPASVVVVACVGGGFLSGARVEDCDTGGVFGITAGFIKKAKIHAFTLPLAGNKDDLDPANNEFRFVEILDNSAETMQFSEGR